VGNEYRGFNEATVGTALSDLDWKSFLQTPGAGLPKAGSEALPLEGRITGSSRSSSESQSLENVELVLRRWLVVLTAKGRAASLDF